MPSSDNHSSDPSRPARRRAMEAFAASDAHTLAAAWDAIAGEVPVTSLRGPEVGLVMLQGRIVGPALTKQEEADRRSAEETEATRVDFFTMVRGDE